MDIQIEDWEQESGHYLAIGKKIKDLEANKTYLICGFTDTSIVIRKVNKFSKDPVENSEIEFSELLLNFKLGVLFVEGFEEGQIKELKIAVSSLEKKLKLIGREKEISEKKRLEEEAREQAEKQKLEKESLRKRQAQAKEFELDIITAELSI